MSVAHHLEHGRVDVAVLAGRDQVDARGDLGSGRMLAADWRSDAFEQGLDMGRQQSPLSKLAQRWCMVSSADLLRREPARQLVTGAAPRAGQLSHRHSGHTRWAH